VLVSTELLAARPPLIRAMNEQLILEHIKSAGPCSRADLARISGLSKPTVSLALANVERAGLVRQAGQRTGLPGRTAVLYEIRPEAGFVLGLDIGSKYLRGALADLSGVVRSRETRPVAARSVRGRIAELVGLADELCGAAGITRSDVAATVIGAPGIYDPDREAVALPGGLIGWDKPGSAAGLREAFGDSVRIENDVNASALAERVHGHGREASTFAFVHVGTGISVGVVINGKLHRGAHGFAGEIAFMPLGDQVGQPDEEARRRGALEAAAAASGIVRAARAAGMRGPLSARKVFAAAARGDERATEVVAAEAHLVAQAICCVVAVLDPELVVLGGGVGQAPGFAPLVADALRTMAPVQPLVKVSALGVDVVVDGCLAEGASLAWRRLTAG
jgi:predicted NBD/HSP70 family sugar kinase